MRGRDLRRSVEPLQLSPETGDVRVERVLADVRAVRPPGTDEVAAPDRLTGPRKKRGEQPELGRRQRHLLRGIRDRVCKWVEAQTCRLERLVAATSAQDRLKPCDELHERERLREVVVAAGIETCDPVDERVARGEENNRCLDATRPQCLAEV